MILMHIAWTTHLKIMFAIVACVEGRRNICIDSPGRNWQKEFNNNNTNNT